MPAASVHIKMRVFYGRRGEIQRSGGRLLPGLKQTLVVHHICNLVTEAFLLGMDSGRGEIQRSGARFLPGLKQTWLVHHISNLVTEAFVLRLQSHCSRSFLLQVQGHFHLENPASATDEAGLNLW